MAEKMQQWTTNQDGLDKLVQEEVEVPVPQTGEVLVKINAVSLNYRDTEVCMGLYGHHKALEGASPKVVPCSDMCGTIVQSNSPLWQPGQRVLSTFNQSHLTGQVTAKDMTTGLGLPLPGVLTQYRTFKPEHLVAAPSHLTPEQASTLPIATVTAWMALNWHRPMNHPANNSPISPATGTPEVVLLQGTGGVSIAGLQIAHAAGCTTIITSSSDAKLARASADLGATHTINYKTDPNWEEKVMELTGGAGADVIFETGGAQTLRKSFECVGWGGMIDCIGYLSGKEEVEGDKLHTNVLALRRNVTVKGIINGPKDRFEEAVRFYEEKGIVPVVDKVFTFEQAKEAIQYLYSGSHLGKVVIKVA